jgi:metallophosphoesterase superfamily enzyme
VIHGSIDNAVAFCRLIDQWRQCHKNVQFLIVTGNHDLRSGELLPQFRFDQVAAEIILDPFIFIHKPKLDSPLYGISGHLHPAITLAGKGRLKETLPCFCFGNRAAILPAFGSFTGHQVIRPKQDDRVYVIAGDEVLKVQNEGSPFKLRS